MHCPTARCSVLVTGSNTLYWLNGWKNTKCAVAITTVSVTDTESTAGILVLGAIAASHDCRYASEAARRPCREKKSSISPVAVPERDKRKHTLHQEHERC